jgi:hypothetical protein
MRADSPSFALSFVLVAVIYEPVFHSFFAELGLDDIPVGTFQRYFYVLFFPQLLPYEVCRTARGRIRT